MQAVAESRFAVRALTRDDLDAVVAIDAAIEGHSRRAYIERRLDAALREPQLHAQFAATDVSGQLVGHLLARVLEGEFGLGERSLRLEMVSVRAELQGHGAGRKLFEALEQWALRRGIRELRTQAAWNAFPMVHWLDAMGFELAPAHVVDCPVAGGAYVAQRDDPAGAAGADEPSREIDFGGQRGNDFERLARDQADVHAMGAGDLADIVRIDRAVSGAHRDAYVERKFNEAQAGSAIRVSLTARIDSSIVGFLMARVDLGDFGRTEPVAVLDTIGVDPAYARRGVGHALLSQLFVNLGALRIERVETVVSVRDLALLGFLYAVGFAPSQRISFIRLLGPAR